MTTLRVGHSLDKCIDMAAVNDPSRVPILENFIKIGREEGAEIFQIDVPDVKGGEYFPPTLVTNVGSNSTLVQEEIFGPVLTVQTFRTPKEAIALANNSNYGLAASVWSENIGLALETAISLKAGAMWVNAHNIFDAAAGFGGYKESGIGREGGREGLYAYLKPAWQSAPQATITPAMREAAKGWGGGALSLPTPATANAGSLGPPDIDRTPKMYIGGKQKRPDGAHSTPIYAHDGEMLSQVGDGNRKDIRDAVEAAHAAGGGWGKRAAHDRAQVRADACTCRREARS